MLAAVNMVGGFVVTDRMLQMFVRKKPKTAAGSTGEGSTGGRVMPPTWVQLAYLACAVCFILALKGLSGPKTARAGNLIGAAAAVRRRARSRSSTSTCDHVPLILARSRSARSVGVVGAQRVQMTQMPQMVALFNGVGGGAAALVALLELHEHRWTPSATASTGSSWPRPRSRSSSARSRSPARSSPSPSCRS